MMTKLFIYYSIFIILIFSSCRKSTEPVFALKEYKVAYTSPKDPTSPFTKFIYVMNVNSKNTSKLINDNQACWELNSSSDGNKLLYISNHDIWILNIASLQKWNVTNSNKDVMYISFSQDASKIVYCSRENQSSAREVYTINSDGTDKRRLTFANSIIESNAYPKYSPDKSKIAFKGRKNSQYDIFLMNDDGSEHVNLSNDIAQEFEPYFSPDGAYIFYYSRNDTTGNIFRISLNNYTKEILTPELRYDILCDISSDGSKLLYVSYDNSGVALYTMNVDGDNNIRLTNDNMYFWLAKFSFDGLKVVFRASKDLYGPADIFIVDTDGSNQKNLTNSSYDEDYPVFCQ